jgi:hypothetical protein
VPRGGRHPFRGNLALRTRVARLLAASTIVALACLVPSGPARADASRGERIVLKPEDRAGWSPTQIFGAMRPDYHSARTLHVETSPPGATLDLFYVRASFQKRYEQAQAPVVLELPTRSQAGKRDSITIRAFLPGHRIETRHVPVKGSEERVLIELRPLDNTLVSVAHTYFAGRAGLSMLLRSPAAVRVQKAEHGFSLILAQTAGDPGAEAVLGGLRSPLVASASAQQLGEDLLVKVQLPDGVTGAGLELRSREQADAVRGLHRFTVDMIPRGQTDAGVERARAALGQIGTGDVTGCATAFDGSLRRSLDREQLARALAPRGDFTDPYLRAALRRLGEVSPGGVIQLEDGARYRPGVPLELAAAASQAASARGYLALLRQWVRLLEPEAHRTEALRSLVAPELQPDEFARALARARAAEGSCRGGASASAGSRDG